MEEDKRLERLFEDTKFHIGIYLSAGGGLLALLCATNGATGAWKELVGSPLAVLLALVAMVIAGLAGGVVASAATRSSSFEQLWSGRQGPGQRLSGRAWAAVEHYAFWGSVVLIAVSVLTGKGTLSWAIHPW